MFAAQHAGRYARQSLITQYNQLTGANLIVMIDAIFAHNMTLLEELLFDADPEMPLHLLLASPGGDGEAAIRMVRSMQQRCTELTVIVPDMAKSAATLLCLGADHIVMGPNGDLGPVDPQFQFHGGLAGAKELVAAIDEAEARVRVAPDTFPLFANLLAEVNMIMVQQARSALARSQALVDEALRCRTGDQTDEQVRALAEQLEGPLIGESKSHSAVISAGYAQSLGLPVETPDLSSDQWRLVWNLWTRYYTLGCWPAGQTAVYEGARASHIQSPQGM
ncbi:SDH family Clp fold serine proteinase [Micromonospora aurantiaca]|uniref:SDH family Clp fold serine proteinase n=1 Tax=Micromonospora aurantiaca (nom. illeg.) TaxID=47850 RepID=UPI0023DDB252|nr:ATP-dependent Clp protease proteolytic subunit [Micromonospora aurantiaca]